jgi:hypothetical protein
MKGPAAIIAGTQPFTCLNTQNMETIGNAVGVLTALDPLDGTKLWTTNQWSNDAARCVWNTRIVEYQVEDAAPRSQDGKSPVCLRGRRQSPPPISSAVKNRFDLQLYPALVVSGTVPAPHFAAIEDAPRASGEPHMYTKKTPGVLSLP